MIPEDVKRCIELEAEQHIVKVQTSSCSIDKLRDIHRRLGFLSGASFGYQLRDEEVNELKSHGHSFVQYHPDIVLPDGIYNGMYNKEPAIIRIYGGEPTYVSFIGFLNTDGESQSSAIFDKRGIIASNVEILLKSHQIETILRSFHHP